MWSLETYRGSAIEVGRLVTSLDMIIDIHDRFIIDTFIHRQSTSKSVYSKIQKLESGMVG